MMTLYHNAVSLSIHAPLSLTVSLSISITGHGVPRFSLFYHDSERNLEIDASNCTFIIIWLNHICIFSLAGVIIGKTQGKGMIFNLSHRNGA